MILLILNLRVKLTFNSFALGLQHDNMLFSDVNGNMSVSDYVQTSNLRFSYLGQKIKVDGKFHNLPEWLAGRPVELMANANISFDKLNPEVFEVKNSDQMQSEKQLSICRKTLYLI